MKVRSRTTSTWICCALLFVTMGSAHAQAGVAGVAGEVAEEAVGAPFLGGFLKETRVVYPLRVGDWEAKDEHLYEQQALGASVRYADGTHKDRWIDLYFYPAGVLPASRLEVDIAGTLEGIRSSIDRPGGYSEIDIAPVQPLTLTLRSGKQKRRIAAGSTSMRLVREGKAYSSAMVMLVLDLYYVKARFSAEASVLSPRETQKQLDRFVAAVVQGSTIQSSGGCWMPPPIVQKDSLVRDAPGQLATTDKEKVLSAVAYADRTEALEAASPEAKVMQFLSMSLSGRYIEGCGPPEDMNPAVPDGMREIRLEYSAPADGGRNPPIRLRPANKAVS